MTQGLDGGASEPGFSALWSLPAVGTMLCPVKVATLQLVDPRQIWEGRPGDLPPPMTRRPRGLPCLAADPHACPVWFVRRTAPVRALACRAPPPARLSMRLLPLRLLPPGFPPGIHVRTAAPARFSPCR